MEYVTPSVSRAQRTTRRQAMLVCAAAGYLALFAAAAVAVVSLFAATGGIAGAFLLLTGLALVTGGGLWLFDSRAERRRPLATVTPLHAARMAAQQSQRRAAG